MIKVEHLSKRYGTVYALDDISFEIGSGEVVGLLGPNGAGKSTTMNIVTGYLSSTAGEVTVDGTSILGSPAEAKRKIGYLPEQPPLYQEMTVEEYLGFVYELKHCTLPRAPHIDEVLDATHLRDVRRRLIRNLSKGYRQRVGIAQALIGDPPVLIFDEPTVGLDPKQIIEIRSLLRTLGRRHTVILSTHILSEVQAVCERVIIINRGRIVADTKTEEIARAAADARAYRLKIAGPEREVTALLRRCAGVGGVEVGEQREGDARVYTLTAAAGVDVRKPVFFACAERGYPILEFAPQGGDLEEVFLRLVERGSADDVKKAGTRKGRRA